METHGQPTHTTYPLNELRIMLHRWRKAAGLSQVKLAAKIGVTHMSVGLWERGVVRPSQENLDAFAKACKAEVCYQTSYAQPSQQS